jgi:hypothetical protein
MMYSLMDGSLLQLPTILQHPSLAHVVQVDNLLFYIHVRPMLAFGVLAAFDAALAADTASLTFSCAALVVIIVAE